MLEGLPGTLARPEAAGLRLAYALLANLGVGIVLSLCLIRRHLRDAALGAADYGLGGAARTSASVAGAALVGYALFRLSHPQPVDAIVLLNAFAQVWAVSAAEIMVCWALVGATLRSALRPWSRAGAVLLAAAAASVLFGVYHFAHSPPFNEIRMVLFLTAVGFATSLWWFASRDLYGTVVFHNFLGVTGVLAALEAAGKVPERAEPALPLIATAALVTAAIAWPGVRWRKKRKAHA
ncbi:MAG TPA: hypothetical protein VFZ81_12945 [Burkholderiales bacterium]